jgi:hypothetical protein
MRKIFSFLITIFIATSLWGQAPEGINYQAVIRNSSGNVIPNTRVGIQISLLQDGAIVYSETFSPITNSFGLVNLELGKGSVLRGDFKSINWDNGAFSVMVELDVNGGNDYKNMGTSPLLSVPFAMHSKTAEVVINETDPQFSNWDKSTGITITESQITDLDHFSNEDEIDPEYATDSAFIKTGIKNWNNSLAKTIDASDTSYWGRVESDPLFATWDKSTGILISKNQITDLDYFTTSDEIDPKFSVSVAKKITAEDTVRWNSKLDNYSENDPLFSSWNKRTGITIAESQIIDLDHFTNSDEIDPQFSAWNKSSGITITESQISDLDHFTTSDERDPRFAADSSFIKTGVRSWNNSLAKTIDAADTTRWGKVETDPVFSAWNKSTGITITESQIIDLDHFTTADETDPQFSAWDKSTGITITESQISDLDHFTTTDEIDPRFTADSSFIKIGVRSWNNSLAKTIDAADTTRWGKAETDPVFSAWDKSTGITITESQITDLNYFTNSDETDPVFSAWNKSTGITITESQITDLDHFTTADETDPIFSASPANSITNAGSGAIITAAERTKLSGIAEGAEVNVNADWNATSGDAMILNKPSFDTSVNFSGSLSGDVSGIQSATLVESVGGQSAANIAAGAVLANAATNTNTASSIVRRDASGNFTAGTITATIIGNVTGNLSGNAATATSAINFSGALSGDVTGNQASTVVSTVGGVTAANVASGANLANASTNTNTASTIVRRDASGNFSAETITVSGLTIAGGTPGEGKLLISDAIGNATWQNPPTSTTREITRSRFQLTDINGAYILNGQSLGENNDITDYRNHFIAPYNGKLLKIVVKSEVAMGSTAIRMHINQNLIALETQTVDIALPSTAYTFTFTSSAVFNAGDDIELFVDPTTLGASTSSKVSFSIVWEY